MPPALQEPDDLLVARLIGQESGAWEALLAEHGGLISEACRKALAFCGLPADAASVADASAEVVRLLLEEDRRLLRRFRPGASLGAYLRVIARSRTLDAARRHPPRMPHREPAPVPSPEDLARRVEWVARLHRALAGLAPRDAEALRLFHLEGLGYAEVAGRTGLPEAQVGTVLARARERLRRAMGGNFPDFV